ncbi:hypothetical protein MXB_4284, partial [Myxobolus squamalis]
AVINEIGKLRPRTNNINYSLKRNCTRKNDERSVKFKNNEYIYENEYVKPKISVRPTRLKPLKSNGNSLAKSRISRRASPKENYVSYLIDHDDDIAQEQTGFSYLSYSLNESPCKTNARAIITLEKPITDTLQHEPSYCVDECTSPNNKENQVSCVQEQDNLVVSEQSSRPNILSNLSFKKVDSQKQKITLNKSRKKPFKKLMPASNLTLKERNIIIKSYRKRKLVIPVSKPRRNIKKSIRNSPTKDLYKRITKVKPDFSSPTRKKTRGRTTLKSNPKSISKPKRLLTSSGDAH